MEDDRGCGSRYEGELQGDQVEGSSDTNTNEPVMPGL